MSQHRLELLKEELGTNFIPLSYSSSSTMSFRLKIVLVEENFPLFWIRVWFQWIIISENCFRFHKRWSQMNLNLFLTDDIKLIMDSCLEEHDGLNTVRNTMRKSTPKWEHYTQVITSLFRFWTKYSHLLRIWIWSTGRS